MSPEERAKHVCGILAVEGVSHFGEDWERLQKLIAQAIRDAEDAALERAAAVADAAGDTWSGSRCVEAAMQEAAADEKATEIARAIRDLKGRK